MDFKEFIQAGENDNIQRLINQVFGKSPAGTNLIRLNTYAKKLSEIKEPLIHLDNLIKQRMPKEYSDWKNELAAILKTIIAGNAAFVVIDSMFKSLFTKWSNMVKSIDSDGIKSNLL